MRSFQFTTPSPCAAGWGGSARARGFGDVLLGGKVNFFGNDGGDRALGAIGFVEMSFEYATDPNIGTRHTLDPSLQWLVTPNLQLDAASTSA